ncbi:MAG: hypothetical protein ACLQVI_21575 [Polyangiaceae bacterium]
MTRTALLLTVAVMTFTLSQTASAQTNAPTPTPGNEPTTDQRALAEMLFFTGKGMMGDGRIPQACQKFAESYRLDPAAGTLLNLAVCHEKEGKIASSWGEFRQALAEAKRANRQDRIDLAEEAIKRIEPDLPFVAINVPAGVKVAGLEIRRNGVPLQAGAWDTELPIDPGTNEILVTAPLYKPETKTVTIDKKQHLSVTIDALELAPVFKPPPPYWTSERKLGAGLLVGGAVVAIVGGVFGGLALSEKSTSDQNCPTQDGQLRCTTTGANAMSTAQTDAWVADFGIGIGAAAIVVGGVMILTGGAKEEAGPAPKGAPPKEASAWGFRVVSGAHGGEAFLTRSF